MSISANAKHELRFTETNSADDSAGKTWGLEGNLFWFVAGGAFAAVLTLLLLFSVWRWTLLNAAVPIRPRVALCARAATRQTARLRHRSL
jgi:Flp pilus assembly protein TadB